MLNNHPNRRQRYLGRCTPEAIERSRALHAAIDEQSDERWRQRSAYDHSLRFELQSDAVTVPAGTVGRVTFVAATTGVYPRPDNGRERAIASLLHDMDDAITAANELARRAERGELPTCALLRATRHIYLPRGVISALRLATLERAFAEPGERARFEALIGALDRVAAVPFPTGRGVLSGAAQRVLDGAEPNMILGAMS